MTTTRKPATLARMTFMYPDDSLQGDAVRVLPGSPLEVLRESVSGHGRNKATRFLVRADYLGRAWYGWINADNMGAM